MTPANIVGMAALKGLDVIALTDHNSSKNAPAFHHFAKKYGILALTGMELCTIEEVHVVCLFPTLNQTMDFDKYIEKRIVPIPNKEEIFGNQLICDLKDHYCGKVENLLINRTDISFDGLWKQIRTFGGAMFPAHVDKSSNSLVSNLGFIPPDSKFSVFEIKDKENLSSIKKLHPYLNGCMALNNSDAHRLGDIKEPDDTLDVEVFGAQGVIDCLLGDGGKNC